MREGAGIIWLYLFRGLHVKCGLPGGRECDVFCASYGDSSLLYSCEFGDLSQILRTFAACINI